MVENYSRPEGDAKLLRKLGEHQDRVRKVLRGLTELQRRVESGIATEDERQRYAKAAEIMERGKARWLAMKAERAK